MTCPRQIQCLNEVIAELYKTMEYNNKMVDSYSKQIDDELKKYADDEESQTYRRKSIRITTRHLLNCKKEISSISDEIIILTSKLNELKSQ